MMVLKSPVMLMLQGCKCMLCLTILSALLLNQRQSQCWRKMLCSARCVALYLNS